MFISILTPSIRPQYLNITQECLERQTNQEFEWIVGIGLKNRGFSLPSDMNTLLRRSCGERIIILQDCINIPDDFVEYVSMLPNECFTFPVGKIMSIGDKPEWDWRVISGIDGEITPNLWETDLACAPRQAFFDVGGYDEEFNKGWSWDNVEIAWRIAATGRKFYNDPHISGLAIDHDKKEPHPWRDTLPRNDKRAEETRKKASHGDFKLNYL